MSVVKKISYLTVFTNKFECQVVPHRLNYLSNNCFARKCACIQKYDERDSQNDFLIIYKKN